MSQSLDLSNLNEHIQRSFTSIGLLYNNQQYSHAKYLAFILIDQLAWLISGSQQQVNIYFKDWVNRYFIQHYPEITAEEIWASRNGHLHNHSSISRDIENNKVSRQLWFIDNVATTNELSHYFEKPLDVFFPVNTCRFLQVALLEATNNFMTELTSTNSFDLEEIKFKLGKVLKPVYPDI